MKLPIGPSRNHSPFRDAVDNRFQHTLDVLIGITMGYLILQSQELSFDMLILTYRLSLLL